MSRAFTRALCRVGALALAVGGAALAAPSLVAAAPPASCGHTIHRSVKLTHDLKCTSSSQDGITVGAPGITINLNGFAIDGAGGTYGINNDSGFNGVTVENGNIKHFGTGIKYNRAAKGKITNVSLTKNVDGVDFVNSRRGVIRGSTASGSSDDGFFLRNNHKVSLINSKANYNGKGVEDVHSLDTLSGDVSSHNLGYGFSVDRPLTFSTPTGRVYWTVMNSTAKHNGSDGFHVATNLPTTLYQAKLTGNHSDYNAAWGYWAEQKAKGDHNFAIGNGSGNCFHVQCSLGP